MPPASTVLADVLPIAGSIATAILVGLLWRYLVPGGGIPPIATAAGFGLVLLSMGFVVAWGAASDPAGTWLASVLAFTYSSDMLVAILLDRLAPPEKEAEEATPVPAGPVAAAAGVSV